MQLKQPKRIIASLAAATGALLAPATADAGFKEELERWSFDAALLYYDEGDRVSDISANIRMKNGSSVEAGSWWDDSSSICSRGLGQARLRGAAANVHDPSGNSTYVTPAGETPLTAVSRYPRGSTRMIQPVGGRSTLDFGVSVSNEYDYFSPGSTAGTPTSSTSGIRRSHRLAYANDSVDPAEARRSPSLPNPAGRHEQQGRRRVEERCDL